MSYSIALKSSQMTLFNLHQRNALYYLIFDDQKEPNDIFVLFIHFYIFFNIFLLFNSIITHVIHIMLIMFFMCIAKI